MLKTGILNPQILALLGRVRHTNTLVIADRGFPYWPTVETVDLSLIDDIPRVLNVLKAVREQAIFGKVWMAEEFLKNNEKSVIDDFTEALQGVSPFYEPHDEFKKRVPQAIGLIRTGETIQYANMILESA